MTAKKDDLFDPAMERTEKLKAAEVDTALRLMLWEAARDRRILKQWRIAELQEQLSAKSDDLSNLSAKHSELTNELNCAKLRSASAVTILDDRNLVAGSCERLTKQARAAR